MTNPIRARIAALVLVAGAVASCAGYPSSPAARTSVQPSTTLSASRPSPSVAAATPGLTPATTLSPKACVASTLASMTEAQRIGQLFAIGLPNAVLDDRHRAAIVAWHFGSVWLARSTAGVASIRTVADAVQALATTASTDGVRFLVGANQEGGLVQGLSGTGFDPIPSALVQGRLPAATLAGDAAAWGRELRAAGVNLDFAPVADVVPPGTDAHNAPIGQLQREYGHHPPIVSDHVAAFIDGMRAAGVATTAKHFPGLGRVAANTDDAGDVTDSVTTSHDAYLQPFARAIAAHVPFVMVSLATYRRIDRSSIAAFSSKVMKGLLRTALGFHGVIASDSLSAAAVKGVAPVDRAVRFLEAGGDLIVIGALSPAIAMAKGLATRADDDPAFAKLIDAAARHVLRAKADAGVLTCPG